MNITRSGLALFFSSLVVGLMVSNCTVNSSDDDDTNCTPNSTAACTCSNGAKGNQTCNSEGSGFGACVCAGGSGGSAGSSSQGGSGGSTAGAGGQSTAGSGGASAGAGGVAAGAGGASGGSGGADPGDACDACAKTQCAEEWGFCHDTQTACSGISSSSGGAAGAAGSAGTPSEYACISGCMLGKRDVTSDAFISSNDLKTCIEDSCNLTNAWWDRASSQETRVLVNCIAGPGWESDSTAAWKDSKCKNECFSRLTPGN